MTKEEILAMKPGRDLDIEVAIEVMDYIWITHMIHFSEEMTVKWLGTKQDVEKSGGVYVVVAPDKLHSLKLRQNYDEAVPPFSTETNAAKQIAEKLAQEGFLTPADDPAEICKAALLTRMVHKQ